MDSDKENTDVLDNMDRLTQRAEIRNKYKNILKDFSIEDEKDSQQLEMDFLKNAMETANELFTQIDAPQEAVLDAKVFRHLARMCRQQAENLSASAQSFSVFEYADKLCEELGSEIDDESEMMLVAIEQWIHTGEISKNATTIIPHLSFMYGAIPKADIVRKEKQERPRNSMAGARKGESTKATIVGLDDNDQDPTTKKTLTEILVESTYHQLIREYKSNGKNPICYFRFIVNGQDFGKTVENMFHLSFLVKEDKVRIFRDEKDMLPKIEPVRRQKTQTQTQTQDSQSDKNQAVITLSIPQWKSIKSKFGIRGSVLNHDDILNENGH